jgi:cell division protein FtsW
VLSFLVMLFFAQLNYKRLEKLAPISIPLAFGLLAAVLHPSIGTVTNSARRWIRFGSGIGIQPSELAKIALVLFTAWWLSRGEGRERKFFAGYVVPLALAAAAFGLIVLEPDFGTGALVGLVVFILILVAGGRLLHAAMCVTAALPVLGYLMLSSEYRRERLIAFLNPWKYSQDIGYHITQSLIALGSGGLTGVGIGEGRQKLFFLPEASTDFVFAILGEELGFLGTTLVIFLYGAFVWLGVKVALSAKDRFGFLLSMGIVILIATQAAMNIAVVTASVPTKGIALPLLGYGGSSMFFTMAGVGMLLNVAGSGRGEVAQ